MPGICRQTLSPRACHITIPGPRSWRPPWSLSQRCSTGETPSGWHPLKRSSKGNQGRGELELVDVMETPQHLPEVAHKPQTLCERGAQAPADGRDENSPVSGPETAPHVMNPEPLGSRHLSKSQRRASRVGSAWLVHGPRPKNRALPSSFLCQLTPSRLRPTR